jgi:hypothetical protein
MERAMGIDPTSETWDDIGLLVSLLSTLAKKDDCSCC